MPRSLKEGWLDLDSSRIANFITNCIALTGGHAQSAGSPISGDVEIPSRSCFRATLWIPTTRPFAPDGHLGGRGPRNSRGQATCACNAPYSAQFGTPPTDNDRLIQLPRCVTRNCRNARRYLARFAPSLSNSLFGASAANPIRLRADGGAPTICKFMHAARSRRCIGFFAIQIVIQCLEYRPHNSPGRSGSFSTGG